MKNTDVVPATHQTHFSLPVQLRFGWITIAFLFLILACPTFNVAQTQVHGRIADQSGAPLEFANVLLIQVADSALVKGEISGEDGSYIFHNLSPGTYRCTASMVGFDTQSTSDFTVGTQQGDINLGLLVLPAGSAELKTVVVTGRKAMIEIHADKIVFNVASTPSASGVNGLELLGKAPGVLVDMDNNITLLGKGGVQIYINDVPSRLSGNDLATMLQSMTSDNIESIEIITNPSARYDAEGNAGIINIRTKKQVPTGFNGTLNASASKGRYYRNSLSAVMNYGGEKIKASVEINRSQEDIQDDILDMKQQSALLLDLRSYELRNRTGYNAGFGLDAQLARAHTLSVTGRAIFNQNDNVLNSTTDISALQTGQHIEILDSRSLADHPSENFNFNTNYRWTPNKRSLFSADLSLGVFKTDRHTEQPNTIYEPDGTTVRTVIDHAFDANTSIGLYSAKADYEVSWESITLSTGAKYAHIDADNSFAFYNLGNGIPVLDLTKSNDFTYTEDVTALYAIMNAKLGTFFTLNAGMRMEHTASRGRLITEVPINDRDVPRKYTDLFPNVGLSFNDRKTHSWRVGIGRRITRPNYQDLNPFESPLSQLVTWKGNPFLRPNYIMNYELSYAFRQKLTVTNTYSVTRDFFATIFEIMGESGNLLIPRNMQEATSYSIAVSYPLEVTDFWEFATFADGAYRTFRGDLEGTEIDIAVTTYNVRIQNTLMLPWDMLMDITYSKSSDWIWRGSIRVRGNHLLNTGIRKDFLDDRLQIRITANDLLRSNSDFFYNGDYGGILVDGVRTFDNQRFGLSASFKFGNQKVKGRSRSGNALDDELSRLQSSQ